MVEQTGGEKSDENFQELLKGVVANHAIKQARE
jgi:hypothetical protein